VQDDDRDFGQIFDDLSPIVPLPATTGGSLTG
jgi:hypothetical protein